MQISWASEHFSQSTNTFHCFKQIELQPDNSYTDTKQTSNNTNQAEC